MQSRPSTCSPTAVALELRTLAQQHPTKAIGYRRAVSPTGRVYFSIDGLFAIAANKLGFVPLSFCPELDITLSIMSYLGIPQCLDTATVVAFAKEHQLTFEPQQGFRKLQWDWLNDRTAFSQSQLVELAIWCISRKTQNTPLPPNPMSVANPRQPTLGASTPVRLYADDLTDLLLSEFQYNLLAAGRDCVHQSWHLHPSCSDTLSAAVVTWLADHAELLGQPLQTYAPGSDEQVLYTNRFWLDKSSTAATLDLTCRGVPTVVQAFARHIASLALPAPGGKVRWVYSPDGSAIDLPLPKAVVEPPSNHYPHLAGASIADYTARFMASTANILLLVGPPGTGKTTFIRALLAAAGCSALVSYDPAVLACDHFFARFLTDSQDLLVLEDADLYLAARSAGNDLCSRFLNISDGLVSAPNKKLVFTTNLGSVAEIDPALLRPGRCFDVFVTSLLTAAEARLVVPGYTGCNPVSLAALLNPSPNTHPQP